MYEFFLFKVLLFVHMQKFTKMSYYATSVVQINLYKYPLVSFQQHQKILEFSGGPFHLRTVLAPQNQYILKLFTMFCSTV